MLPPELHVVFGAGQIGPHLARLLRARGHGVRLVRRAASPPLDGIPVVSGDAGDAAFATSVTEGASVIYHCMNPAYDTRVWAADLPRAFRGCRDDARRGREAHHRVGARALQYVASFWARTMLRVTFGVAPESPKLQRPVTSRGRPTRAPRLRSR